MGDHKAHLGPRRRRAWTTAGPVGALTCLGLLVAGCGGGSKSPAVASLTTTTSGSGAGNSPVAFALPPGGAIIGASISTDVGPGGVRYTACMRSHGVPNFPDPDSHGTITITVSTSLNPSSPLFERAEGDCQHLLPARKGLSAAQRQRIQATALAFAACMRAHGVPGYPDPTFSSGGVSQALNRKNGIDPSSPIFQSAQKTCQSRRTQNP